MAEEQVLYKKFTAHIQTPTLLDDFAPTYIEEIGRRFATIQELADRYSSNMQAYADDARTYNGFGSVSDILEGSIQYLDEVFSDFRARMKYFTLVFFGAVSAGKTSMICDLANTSPKEITSIISKQPGFDPSRDSVSIGPNVATMNLYEILIEKSCIRLVDVPGIGGVVHDNETLAPFVNMADCIVFLLHASNDITKDDETFLYEHVAALRNTRDGKSPLIQEGSDKRILVVINRWKSSNQYTPPRTLQEDRERKTRWILHGEAGKSFTGIAGFFRKEPEVVCADTRPRDSDTGEPYSGSEQTFDLNEVTQALRQILEDEGADLRLNRPKQVFSREILKVTEKINEEKTRSSLDDLSKELEALGLQTGNIADKVQNDIAERLNDLEQTLTTYLRSKIRSAINDWNPRVGILRGLQGVIPEWFPGAEDIGRPAMRKALKDSWEQELKGLIASRIDQNELGEMVRRKVTAFSNSIKREFEAVFLQNPQMLKRISTMNPLEASSSSTALEPTSGRVPPPSSQMPAPVPKGDVLDSLSREIQAVVNKIQTGILDDIVNLVSWDVILATIAGVILTPAGAFLVAAWRRWKRGVQKGQEAKQGLDYAADSVAIDVAAKIKGSIAERLSLLLQGFHQEIKNVLTGEKEVINEPLEKMEQILSDLKDFQSELEQLST